MKLSFGYMAFILAISISQAQAYIFEFDLFPRALGFFVENFDLDAYLAKSWKVLEVIVDESLTSYEQFMVGFDAERFSEEIKELEPSHEKIMNVDLSQVEQVVKELEPLQQETFDEKTKDVDSSKVEVVKDMEVKELEPLQQETLEPTLETVQVEKPAKQVTPKRSKFMTKSVPVTAGQDPLRNNVPTSVEDVVVIDEFSDGKKLKKTQYPDTPSAQGLLYKEKAACHRKHGISPNGVRFVPNIREKLHKPKAHRLRDHFAPLKSAISDLFSSYVRS